MNLVNFTEKVYKLVHPYHDLVMKDMSKLIEDYNSVSPELSARDLGRVTSPKELSERHLLEFNYIEPSKCWTTEHLLDLLKRVRGIQDKDHVIGDFRFANLIPHQDENGRPKVTIIDLDWYGPIKQEGQARHFGDDDFGFRGANPDAFKFLLTSRSKPYSAEYNKINETKFDINCWDDNCLGEILRDLDVKVGKIEEVQSNWTNWTNWTCEDLKEFIGDDIDKEPDQMFIATTWLEDSVTGAWLNPKKRKVSSKTQSPLQGSNKRKKVEES